MTYFANSVKCKN